MDEICAIATRLHERSPRVHFAIIYIKEAHADDTWPLGVEHGVKQTTSTSERCAIADAFVRRTALPPNVDVLVDKAPQNAFDELFAVWPLRFYVIDWHRDAFYVSFIGEPRGDLMKIADLYDYMLIRGLV